MLWTTAIVIADFCDLFYFVCLVARSSVNNCTHPRNLKTQYETSSPPWISFRFICLVSNRVTFAAEPPFSNRAWVFCVTSGLLWAFSYFCELLRSFLFVSPTDLCLSKLDGGMILATARFPFFLLSPLMLKLMDFLAEIDASAFLGTIDHHRLGDGFLFRPLGCWPISCSQLFLPSQLWKFPIETVK